MRPKTLALLAVAVMCGLVAMMGVQQVLSNQGETKQETMKVLVATAEILPGQPLDQKNTEFKEWPTGMLPEGALTDPEQIKDRAIKVRAFPGDLITAAKVDKKGVRNASSDVPKGKRIASVPIDPTMTGAGLIRPGDKVDVLVTYSTRGRDLGNGIGKEVKTVLEYIEVFAIDGHRDSSVAPTTPANQQSKNVSLLVNQEQAKLLKLADDVGDIHLTLRAQDDEQRTDETELFDPRQAEVAVRHDSESRDVNSTPVSQVEPVTESEPKAKTWKIEIFSGSERRTEEVPLPEELPMESAPTAQTTNGSNATIWTSSIKKLFGG